MFNVLKMCRFAEKHNYFGLSKSEIDAIRKEITFSKGVDDGKGKIS